MSKQEKGKKGLSIITCVTNKTMYEDMVKSVNSHCSCEHEFLSYDNSNGDKSMAQVYNMLVRQAKYNTVLLTHQDVLFLEGNIGKIVDKINADKECGYIGFAGSKIRPTAYAGWCNAIQLHITNYYQTDTNHYYHQAKRYPYDDVVTLDGMALFTRKSFYLEYPLDEKLLDGFHCYDLYLTINAFVNGYNNYVYTNKDIKMLHYSGGDYNIGWYETTMKLTDMIWREYGDLMTDDVNITDDVLKDINKRLNESFLKGYQKIKVYNERKVLYTCITGGYEELKPVKKKKNWDYVCFTDEPFECEGWDVRPLPDEVSGLSNVKKQRYVKLNPHLLLKDYNLSVWTDGNITVNGDIDEFIYLVDANDDMPMVFKIHPGRDCIYDEMDACIFWKRETEENMKKLRQFYENEKFPHHYGLYETNVIVRRHNNPKCARLMEEWTKELLEKSHRDQLSLTYCIWKQNAVNYIKSCPCDICGKYFTLRPHLNN